jgi:hypothetical protein
MKIYLRIIDELSSLDVELNDIINMAQSYERTNFSKH